MVNELSQALIKKLDLRDFFKRFEAFLSRPSNAFLQGDNAMHLKHIQALEALQFTPPPAIKPSDNELALLAKHAILPLSGVVEIVKVIRYFVYLKTLKLEGVLEAFGKDIVIVQDIGAIETYFDDKYQLKDSINADLSHINAQIKSLDQKLKNAFETTLRKSAIRPYLVDTQVHLIEGTQALLLRGGFNKILPSKVIAQSQSGFFYVVPYDLFAIKNQLSKAIDEREAIVYNITRQICETFTKHLLFLQFTQKAFNRFDAYQARVQFAKTYDFNFVPQSTGHRICLKDFAHPALKDPVKVSIDLKKPLTIVTGVNAGGKTMLLKSILTATFLTKNALPMDINPLGSIVGSFKLITPIIEDPQNASANISTFAGRMLKFSKLFHGSKSILVGIDEIELGTDSDEAASLFYAILHELIKGNTKIIVTTHHKQLAQSMADDDRVSLLAALYDEQLERPTYGFLEGTIGKSYAFETALRYNIPPHIVRKAKNDYGKDQENLSTLITKTTKLQSDLKLQQQKLESELQKVDRLKQSLKDEQEQQRSAYKVQKNIMQNRLDEALSEAKQAIKQAKQKDTVNAHQKMRDAKNTTDTIIDPKSSAKSMDKFQVGNHIKYNNQVGRITDIKTNMATIDMGGFRLKVSIKDLKKSQPPKHTASKQAKINIDKPKQMGLSLDLHGMRVDDALEKLDRFLSDAAMNDLSEVLIYHGMGSGTLAKVVRESLAIHPCIIDHKDAPSNQGGFGATIAILR